MQTDGLAGSRRPVCHVSVMCAELQLENEGRRTAAFKESQIKDFGGGGLSFSHTESEAPITSDINPLPNKPREQKSMRT